MRTRTAFCPHGFLIPGKPEPWTIPASEGGADTKASRFCLQCWSKHGQVFSAHGHTRIAREDPCTYGFLDLIQFALKERAFYRDQDRYEFLETELRMHLLEKREAIEKALREQTSPVRNQYVRKVLNAKLHDLQKDDNSEFQVAVNSESYNEHEGGKPEFHPEDESQRSARIVAATEAVDSFAPSEDGNTTARSHEAARSITAHRLTESEEVLVNSRDPLRNSKPQRGKNARANENAELVRAAIEEQGHRIDALTAVTKEEQARAVSRAHKELLAAVDRLPHDEQIAIRMRFLNGADLRDGKPRSRRDIVRELRTNGNGASRWSEWDLRRLEQQAVLRLRQKVKLPPMFSIRD